MYSFVGTIVLHKQLLIGDIVSIGSMTVLPRTSLSLLFAYAFTHCMCARMHAFLLRVMCAGRRSVSSARKRPDSLQVAQPAAGSLHALRVEYKYAS